MTGKEESTHEEMRVVAVEHEPEGEAPAGLLLKDEVDAERDKERAHGGAAYNLRIQTSAIRRSATYLPQMLEQYSRSPRAASPAPQKCPPA